MTIKDILELESGLYTADVDGMPAIIGRNIGKGFTIRKESKPGWDEVNEYDEDGDFIGSIVEIQGSAEGDDDGSSVQSLR